MQDSAGGKDVYKAFAVRMGSLFCVTLYAWLAVVALECWRERRLNRLPFPIAVNDRSIMINLFFGLGSWPSACCCSPSSWSWPFATIRGISTTWNRDPRGQSDFGQFGDDAACSRKPGPIHYLGGVLPLLGEFTNLHEAIYHSAVNFATLGYGDIVMSEKHRFLGPLEAINGVLMIGVSTAALTAVFRTWSGTSGRTGNRGLSRKSRDFGLRILECGFMKATDVTVRTS